MRRLLLFALVLLPAGCGGGPAEFDLGPGLLFAEPAAGPEAPTSSRERVKPLPSPAREPYRVRTGDVLTISILGEPDMTQSLPVGPDGRICYYVAHDVLAADKTFGELRAELRERLLAHFKDPHVTVTGKQYKGNTVTILGMVRKPGEHEVRSDTRLMDALAAAGGIPSPGYWTTRGWNVDLPDLRRAFLLRGDRFVDVNFADLFSDDSEAVARNNVYLRAGDRIYIPSTSSLDNRVIVLGEVRGPKVVRFQRGISFLEAVAEAGGITPAAWERRAFVVRGSLRRPTVIPVNMREVAVGAARDLALRSGDIVFVPKTALGKVHEIATQIWPLLQGVSSAKGLVE